MHVPASVWECISYLTNLLTLSTVDQGSLQQPIGGHDIFIRPPTDDYVNAKFAAESDYLKFRPPSWRPVNDGQDDFVCEYPDFKTSEWEYCSTPTDRTCWIKNKKNATRFDINTDYETLYPKGIVRQITLNIADKDWLNADGMNFTSAKLVNGSYPGPLIQSCWGDTVNITVNNNMKHNGTAVHWHGIRQLRTMHMDGVPGITQCPIAPGDSFVYKWKALQYGSAWYHSHYSVQYADGLLGPLTIYGPHSSSWDEGKYPLMMNDWFHNSAYAVIHGKVPGYPTVLLNGTGNISNYNYYETNKGYQKAEPLKVNASAVPAPYRLHFEPLHPNPPKWGVQPRPKRYLLRLINSAFETGFVFSIDHHMLEVISADFVPIVPYNTTHLHIGIGQRYNVIVTAKPQDYPDGNLAGQRQLFWIRTTSSKCFNIDMPGLQNYETTGILSYYNERGFDSKDPPDTKPWPQIEGDTYCRDEALENLVPIHKWKVGDPANADRKSRHSNNVVDVNANDDKTPGERFDVVGKFMWPKGKEPKPNPDFPVALFSFERTTGVKNTFEPLQINYTEPIFLRLNASKYTGELPTSWAVVNETVGKNGAMINDTDWIYLAMGGRHALEDKKGNGGNLESTGGGHPIHFHGHDFAILQQEVNLPLNSTNIRINENIKNNPPRRDVVLLPANGFVIIAFKADNPGSWIMHCHIAFHASEGLALQVMERQNDALEIWPDDDDAIDEAKRVCKKWDAWKNDCTNHWPGYSEALACWPACTAHSDPKQAKLGCKNLLYDDSGV